MSLPFTCHLFTSYGPKTLPSNRRSPTHTFSTRGCTPGSYSTPCVYDPEVFRRPPFALLTTSHPVVRSRGVSGVPLAHVLTRTRPVLVLCRAAPDDPSTRSPHSGTSKLLHSHTHPDVVPIFPDGLEGPTPTFPFRTAHSSVSVLCDWDEVRVPHT